MVTVAAIFTWKKSDTTNTFLQKHSSKCSQYPGVFVTSPFSLFPDFWTFDLVFRRDSSTVTSHGFSLTKTKSQRGGLLPPLSLKVVWGPPFFISFLGFTYSELQIHKLLPKSDCRFYLDGMTLKWPFKQSNSPSKCIVCLHNKLVSLWDRPFATTSEIPRLPGLLSAHQIRRFVR